MATLVILAGGRATRFGGVKQLAPVGPRGEVIMDLLLERAAAAGVDAAVVVVNPTVHDAVVAHLGRRLRPSPPVSVALQEVPRGTADALLVAFLAARARIDTGCVTLNADDLYPASAIASAVAHLRRGQEHGLVAFAVGATLLDDRPVSRAIVRVDASEMLIGIDEGAVRREGDALWFSAAAGDPPVALAPTTPVSMNMWALQPSILPALDAAVARWSGAEVLLPDVIGGLVREGGGVRVRVLMCEEPCMGLTHADDVDALRAWMG